MRTLNKNSKLAIWVLTSALLYQCGREEKRDTLFVKLPADDTGISFNNEVKQTSDNHILNYSYFFNGGGVAVGDINNDGLEDIYFTANQKSNKLYLNKGNFEFEDITDKAGVAAAQGWKTGVTLADINGDGWLDIYVCRSAMGDSVLRKNLLYINNKDLTFSEKAAEYGIDDSSYSTQAAFFDYDNDNDLDLFVLNHSLQRYAGFNNLLNNAKGQKSTTFGSKLYQNQDGKYVDVSEKAGMISNVLSFGLGVAISDLNNDGFSDMYISNDFNEEDYLYMNNGDGTFTNTITSATDHVSLFSMGSDVADINNDGLPDIYTLDMLPATNERIKLSSGDDNYDKYQLLIGAGFHHQTTRNMLQLNNGDGTYSEIGQFAGISNTDWSWSALFSDFDGDTWKDLYVSNGYEKDYTNMQFLKFTVDEQVNARQTGQPLQVQTVLDNMPSINEGNFLFKNNADLSFSNKTSDWGLGDKVKSSGAAYADLDNDGDPDLVINGMNTPSMIYQNTTVEKKLANFVKVDLLKKNRNKNIIGTKLVAYIGNNAQFFEFSPVRGYQSSMYSPMSIGLGKSIQLDSLTITWPNGKRQTIGKAAAGTVITPSMEDATQSAPVKTKVNTPALFDSVKLVNWKHRPAPVNDFKRQLLLPHMYSYSGPKMATGDVNKDGLEDIFICGPLGQSSTLLLQQNNGTFKPDTRNSFAADTIFQNENATFFDADGDGDNDLYVVGGGYMFNMGDPLLQDRLYRNDGKGVFRKDTEALPQDTEAGSVAVPFDADGDKDLDLFVGGRLTPAQYPVNPRSYLLINDGKGKFTNRAEDLAPGLQYTGMVCDAKSIDLNKDGLQDLILAGEWMPIQVWINYGGQFRNETAQWFPDANNGWWNSIDLNDFDNDGDIDLVAGNAGTNNQFGVSEKYPATMIFKDFNFDGQVDPFFCYYINGTSYPYASRDEALGQVSFLKSRFPDYVSYANATIDKVFTPGELQDTVVLRANELRTLLFENTGKSFVKRALPSQAQWSPVYSIASADINNDGLADLLMGGNESYVRVRLGRNNSNRGMVFINKGKGNFEYIPNAQSGVVITGDVREIKIIKSPSRTTVLTGAVGKPIQSFLLRK